MLLLLILLDVNALEGEGVGTKPRFIIGGSMGLRRGLKELAPPPPP